QAQRAKALADKAILRETLAQWLRLKEMESLTQDGGAQERALRAEQAAQEATRAVAARRARRSLGLFIVSTAIAGVAGVAGGCRAAALPLAVVALSAALLSLRRWAAARARLRGASAGLARLAPQLMALQASRAAAQRLSGTLDDLPQVEARLAA